MAASPPPVGAVGGASVAAADVLDSMGVSELCESLWSCEDPNRILTCLDAVCAAMYRDSEGPVTAYMYDPSEIFLALQGAALRNTQQLLPADDPTTTQVQHELSEAIAYKSLLAAAALTRVCVGPAWWNQIYRRRESITRRNARAAAPTQQQHHGDDSSSSSDTDAPATGDALPSDAISNRSWSPITLSSSTLMPPPHLGGTMQEENATYPPIPEVLPAALIRFAASLTESASSRNGARDDATVFVSLVQAQMVLVQSLCCRPEPRNAQDWARTAEAAVPREEWLIPGVQAEIGGMILSWLLLARRSTATTTISDISIGGSDDTAFSSLRLAITRACNDLLSAGWSPSETVCTQMIGALLNIVQAAAAPFLLHNDTHGNLLLVYCAEITEAVSTLTTLGSRGLLPTTMVPLVVTSTSRLYQQVSPWRESSQPPPPLNPSDEANGPENSDDNDLSIQDALKTQQESCFTDVSELLWFLLSSDSFAVVAVESLISVVDSDNYASGSCDLPMNAASGWGETEMEACTQAEADVLVISSALWGDPPGAFNVPLLRTYWRPVLGMMLDNLSTCYATTQRIKGLDTSTQATNHLCRLASELLKGLGKSIKSEIRGGSARLSEVEWESIIVNLERSILPWLQLPGTCTQLEAESFVTLTCDFLYHSTSFERIPFVEYGFLKQLYLTLLQQAVPHLEEKKARLCGSTAIKNWALFGFFPYRLDGWSNTASSLLKEAFRKLENGKYAHDPCVQLEALTAMTAENSIIASHETHDNGCCESAPSLMELTQHMREQHLEFIRCCILPVLQDVLLGESTKSSPVSTEDDSSNEIIFPLSESPHSLPRKVAEALGKKVLISTSKLAGVSLSLYTVQLTGRLYRSVSGHREYRALFVNMLRSVALNKRFDLDPGNLSHDFPVRVTAVSELGRCLEAAIVSLPHAHESVPYIISALCNVFEDSGCSETKGEGSRNVSAVYPMTILAVTALDPLTRLRIAIDRHVAFRTRESAIQESCDILYSFYSAAMKEYRSAVVETTGAPFLEVGDEQEVCSEAGKATSLSFNGIMASMLKYLQVTVPASPGRVSALSFTYKCMRIHCYDVLSHMFLASIPFRIPEAVAREVFSSSGEMDKKEMLARDLALVKCAENEVILLRCRNFDGEPPQRDDLAYIAFMVELVLQLYESPSVNEQAIGCHAIMSLLPSLSALDKKLGTFLMSQVFSSLRRRLEALQESTSLSKLDCRLIMTVIMDILLISPSSEIPKDLTLKLFKFCMDIVMERALLLPGNYCVQLSMKCVSGLLDRMSGEDLEHAKQIQMNLSDSPAETSPVRAIVKLIELLESQCFARIEFPSNGPSFIYFPRNQTMSTVSYNIDNFQCDRSSTWLLLGDNILITCNVGANGTRFQGYIEVITRSLAERRRGLIRIPGQALLEHPDLPPPLRASPRTPNAPGCSTLPADDKRISATKVADVLARFDSLIGNSEEQDQSREPVVSQSDSYNPDAGPNSYKNRGIWDWLKTAAELDRKALSFVEIGLCYFLASCGIPRARDSSVDNEMGHRLIPLEEGGSLKRSVAVLDRTPSASTHKIALLYDQSALPSDLDMETRLLTTNRCSPAFHGFAAKLGVTVPTWTLGFSGGLDTSTYESDGKYALTWSDEDDGRSPAATSSVVFHVVSLMPDEGPVSKMNRKRHVGNDYVLILFADGGSDAIVDYDLLGGELIGGAFGFVVIFVTCPRAGIYRVNIRIREDRMDEPLKAILRTFVTDKSLSDRDAPAFVRATAMRADLACRTGTGNTDATSNYIYRFELLQGMERFEKLS